MFFLFISTCTFSQQVNWTFSFGPIFSFIGPCNSIANAMKKQGYSYNQYPVKERGWSVLFRVSLKQKHSRNLFFIFGVSDAATVKGFHYESMDPFSGVAFGTLLPLEYQVVQFSSGYQFDIKHFFLKAGIAPSVFLFAYNITDQKQHVSIVPGISLNALIDLFNKKKNFGVQLFTEFNLVPPAKMKALKGSDNSILLQPNHVNMIHADAGLLLMFGG